MSDLLFDPQPQPVLKIVGSDRLFPVNRIFCVGRNYVAHAEEMGVVVDREAPWYFTKSQSALLQSPAVQPYPPETKNYHHEMELVVAIGAPAFRVSRSDAMRAVFGYGAGLDMTRRDLQAKSKEDRRPWCTAKDVEGGAVISKLMPASDVSDLDNKEISLDVNGETRQHATLSDQVWSVEEILCDLSKFYHLVPGDLIMTGTPAGVGPVGPGDEIKGSIEGVGDVELRITSPEE